jgi:hypothetical protein
MITAIIIICVLIAILRWIKTDRKYKEAQVKAMTPEQPKEPERDDTEYTIKIPKDKKLNRVQWYGSGTWKYWEDDRPAGYQAQTFEYSHQKRDGVDYLTVIEES